MNEFFFNQLGLPDVNYNLGVGSGTREYQISSMIPKIYKIINENEYAVVLVQGDTNSVLSGAIATKKTKTKLGHIEAGLRSYDDEMPEGIGIEKIRKSKLKGEKEKDEWVLIDPQTAEIISKVAKLDEDGREKIDRSGKVVYKVNDHWFVLNVKFVWRDAPKEKQRLADSGQRIGW